MDTVFLLLSVVIGDLFRSAFLRVSFFVLVSFFVWANIFIGQVFLLANFFIGHLFYWPIGHFLRVSLWKDGEDEIGRCQSFSIVMMTLTQFI